MFYFVEKHNKIVKVIMFLIVATFVFWGIGSYLKTSMDDAYLAKVGDTKIYTNELNQIMRNNPQLTDKNQILLNLINRQLLINNFDRYHVVVSKNELQDSIAKIPNFQVNGKFNQKTYLEFLQNSNLTIEKFQNDIKHQILINKLLDSFKDNYFSSANFNQQYVNLLSKERIIESYKISPEQFYKDINVTQNEINDYYKQNIDSYTKNAKVKVSYLNLNIDNIAHNVIVPEDKLQKYITDNQTILENKQVDAMHILFKLPKDANKDVKAKIHKKAQEVLELVLKNPNNFAKYAKQYSEDITANKGGDLGFISRGIMVRAFEDVAFNLKQNQIYPKLVLSDFGFHIIKLKAIKINDKDTIRNLAEQKMQVILAQTDFNKKLEQLNTLTYNNPQTLDIAAKQLGLNIIRNPNWINKKNIISINNNKNTATINSDDFNNDKIQMAIFDDDVLNKHNNSAIVDLGNNNYAVYQVTEYQPKIIEKLEDVRDDIILHQKRNKALVLANNLGNDYIKKLQNSQLKLDFKNNTHLNLLAEDPNIPSMLVKQIFAVNINKLPAYTGGIDNNGNFIIYKILSEAINKNLVAQNMQIIEQMDTNNSMLELGSYLKYLQSKYTVEYRDDKLRNLNNQQDTN